MTLLRDECILKTNLLLQEFVSGERKVGREKETGWLEVREGEEDRNVKLSMGLRRMSEEGKKGVTR